MTFRETIDVFVLGSIIAGTFVSVLALGAYAVRWL
jgi:hypothetical protein